MGAPAARPQFQAATFVIMVNFWQNVNHHEVVYDRSYNQIADDHFAAQARIGGGSENNKRPERGFFANQPTFAAKAQRFTGARSNQLGFPVAAHS